MHMHALIARSTDRVRTKTGPDGNPPWGSAHFAAMTSPRRGTHEAAIVELIHALANYADAHTARFESKIGNDGFLGDEWLSILKGTRALLNGETGRLDCGTVDGLLCDMARAAGFEEKDL